jgi:hypothetical protein
MIVDVLLGMAIVADAWMLSTLTSPLVSLRRRKERAELPKR